MAAGSFDAVIHFAGLKAVGESRREAAGVLRQQPGVDVLPARGDEPARRTQGWSSRSSATVYGEHAPVPMKEDFPTSATNPYGWTKVMQEQVFRDAAVADPACGSPCCATSTRWARTPRGTIGEDPAGIPNNLMPLLTQVAVGRREKLLVYGDDYPTPGRHRAPRLPARRGPRRRPRRRARAARHHRRVRSRRGTSAPAAHVGHGDGATPSRAPAATTCRTRSRRVVPATSPSRTPTPRGPQAELGWTAEPDGRPDVRRQLALAVAEPGRLPGLIESHEDVAEDGGFEPARAVNPTRFPSERHRPLGESSAEEATQPRPAHEIAPAPATSYEPERAIRRAAATSLSDVPRSPRLAGNPPCGGISPNPPGPEGSKGRRALPGAWGASSCPGPRLDGARV